MKWEDLYPDFNFENKDNKVQFADVGCGYGGLLGKTASVQIMENLLKSFSYSVSSGNFSKDPDGWNGNPC